MYYVEVVWNREFNYTPHGSEFIDLKAAIGYVNALKDSGDGARVKSGRVVDREGKVVWCDGKYTEEPK